MQILEAVPNISDGKNLTVIRDVARAATGVAGVRLLHTDSNPDANRTVFTLAGPPQALVESVFLLIKSATEKIDMRTQHGAHPRVGAVDVCPLVPLQAITLSQAALWADKLARRTGQELHIPVYLYEQNAANARKDLAFIRRGGYEQLAQKLRTLPPDYGPQTMDQHVAKTGASVIGARKILIAFNMSLNTTSVTAAQEIAACLREKNGGLKCVKAIGWYMPHYKCAQVSCNLTDFTQTGLSEVFETCKKLAAMHQLQITAGELIGLAPQEALIQAGRFYAPNQTDPDTLISVAVNNLLLNKIRPFDANTRLLERLIALQ